MTPRPSPPPDPPRLAVWILRHLLLPQLREPILGDLHEEYLFVAASVGLLRAQIWYWRQVRETLRPGLGRRLRDAAASVGMPREVRQAARSLMRRPSLTAVVITTLGAGVGTTTALFSVVDAALLRPLPFAEGERLVTAWNTYDSWRGDAILDKYWDHIELSWPEFVDWRGAASTFEESAVYSTWRGTLTGAGDAAAISVGSASAELLDVLRVQPALGRFFATSEVGAGAPRLAVLDHALWSTRFGQDPGALGRRITLDGVSFEVIGVLPAGFRVRALNAPAVFESHSIWIPVGAMGEELDRGNHRYEALGRLAPGASLQAAVAETVPILRGDADPARRGARLAFRKDEESGVARRPLLMLLGSVSLLLLIACGNVAGLLLSDAARRRTELATRAALGAGRARITRQLLTEGVMLGVGGMLIGVAIAYGGVQALLRTAPDDLFLPSSLGVDLRALTVALILGVGVGAILGLVVGGTSVGPGLAGALRCAGGTGSRSGMRLQRGVVAGQLAVSLVLLVCGGLVLRSLDLELRVDPGFQARDLVTAYVSLPPARYGTRNLQAAFFHELRARLEAIPGIEEVSGVSPLPFAGEEASSSFQIVGREGPQGEKQPEANRRTVLPRYHELMGIPLLAGRHLTAADRDQQAPAVVISRSMAERHWPEGDALGSRVYRDRREFEIVGVVGDVLHRELTGDAEPTFYVPVDVAESPDAFTLVMRSTRPLDRTASLVRETVWDLDDDLPVGDVSTLSALLDRSTREERFRATLLTAFALAATTLASLGLFGSTSRMARARRRELGVRLALGARPGRLLFEVVRSEAGMLAGGLALGMGLTYVASRQVNAYLFGVSPLDPATWLASGVGLFTVALASTIWAARGAVRVDPVEAIRAD
jgi:predicted permease